MTELKIPKPSKNYIYLNKIINSSNLKKYISQFFNLIQWLLAAFLILFSIAAFTENYISGFLLLGSALLTAPFFREKALGLFEIPNKNIVFPIVITLLFFIGISQFPKKEVETENTNKTNDVAVVAENQEVKQDTKIEEVITTEVIQMYEVISVVDGDTLKINIDGIVETVRLVGIDTPETKHPSKPVECLGKEATEELKKLVSGKNVILENDETQSNRDRYDRLLRFVFLTDKTDVGLELIKRGYAHESLYSSKPHKYHQDYVYAESEAERLNLGLWDKSVCPEATPVPTPIPTPNPTPTITPKPYIAPTPYPTKAPTPIYVAPPTTTNVTPPTTSSSYTCNCSKTCDSMSSCTEAYYQLNTCGCSARDGDNDGVPCESICR